MTADPQPMSPRSAKAAGFSVGVVAPDEILTRRVIAVLARAGFEVAGTGPSTIELAATLPAAPAVVVLAAGSEDAYAAVQLVRQELDQSLVAVIALDSDVRIVRDMITAGADAIVLEADLEQSLGTAIAAVLAGQVVLPRVALEHLVRPVLSTREKQIAGMVVLGFTNGEIAQRLHVAETTVKSHLTSIFRKLGVRSRSEASARILDPHDGLGVGILAIAGTDPALDVFGDA
jgi:DNA-binding NarL/FixJ family response regulator